MGRRLKRTEEEKKEIREENEKRRERMWKNIQEEVEKLKKEMFKDPLFNNITEKFGKIVKSPEKEENEGISGQPEGERKGSETEPFKKNSSETELKEDINGSVTEPKEGINGGLSTPNKKEMVDSVHQKIENGGLRTPLEIWGIDLNNDMIVKMTEYIILNNFYDRTKLFLVELLTLYKNSIIKLTRSVVESMGFSVSTFFKYTVKDIKKDKLIRIKSIKQGRNGFTIIDFTLLVDFFEGKIKNDTFSGLSTPFLPYSSK